MVTGGGLKEVIITVSKERAGMKAPVRSLRLILQKLGVETDRFSTSSANLNTIGQLLPSSDQRFVAAGIDEGRREIGSWISRGLLH